MNLNHFSTFSFIQISILISLLINTPIITCENQANWFSKSLDNYQLNNCSFFIRSSIIGDFQSCLNKPNSSSGGADILDFNEPTDDGLDATESADPTTESTTTESSVSDSDWPLSLCP